MTSFIVAVMPPGTVKWKIFVRVGQKRKCLLTVSISACVKKQKPAAFVHHFDEQITYFVILMLFLKGSFPFSLTIRLQMLNAHVTAHRSVRRNQPTQLWTLGGTFHQQSRVQEGLREGRT